MNDVFESLSRMAGCDAVIAAAQAWIEKQNKIISAPASLPVSASAEAEADADEKPLEKMTNQELRDIYNPLIGKRVGMKNSGEASNKAKLIAAIIRLRAEKSSATPVAEAAGSAAEHVIVEVASAPASEPAAAAPVPEPKVKKAKKAKAKSDSEEEKPKRKAAPATMAWNDFVKHCQTKYPERYLDAEGNTVKTPGHRMAVAKAIRAEMPQYYDTFVADFIENLKYTETIAEVDAIISTSTSSKPKND
jgi:hypothetical protein